MIELTQEMIDAFGKAWTAADDLLGPGSPAGSRRRAGIKAVLEIVERDRLGRGPRTMGEVMQQSAGESA